MRRNSCVFCNGSIKELYVQKQFPICFYGTESKDYEYTDLVWCCCESCDIVQLSSLIEPSKLYGVSHNNTFNTPTWKEHHKQFLQFFKENHSSKKIIEIGGGSNILSSKLNNLDYTVLDLYDPHEKIENITYINNNCETFDYNNYDCVIMSHVFEHLYNPAKMVEQLNKSNVKEIFISVPNLKSCLENSVLSFINNEHTFYFEESDLLNLFKNYSLEHKVSFKNHSNFFHFVLKESRSKKILNYFIERENKLSNIVLTKETFIVPSGHFGSMIYYYNKYKDKIIGFLDNDSEKQNKYLYGTDCLTYSFDILKEYNNVDVLLHAGPYSNELIQQINSINPTINVIVF